MNRFFLRFPNLCWRLALCASVGMAPAVMLVPQEVAAQDFATRSAARKLGEEGIALFEKESWAEALEKFNLADQLVPAPTLGVRAARCLVKLGRFVEASERFLEVTRMDLKGVNITPAFRKAQAEALKEREELLPLIPSLSIEVRGPIGEGILVFVDGEQIPSALVGQTRPIDPGKHEVEVRRGETKVTQKVDVQIKRAERLVFELPELPKPKPPEPDPTWRTIAWIGVGFGAGGAIAFGVNGMLAVSLEQDLVKDDKCPNRMCPPQYHADVDRFELYKVATTVGIVSSVVGLAVGVPLLIISPKKKNTPKDEAKPAGQVSVMPVVGPNMVGVKGMF